MEQDVIKIKIIDTIANKTTIVEFADLQSIPEDIKKIIQTVFTESHLIFIGDVNSKLSVEMLYKIAKTVSEIVGKSLEYRITDKIQESMDLTAYLVLRKKNSE
jgi:hypothetical protein